MILKVYSLLDMKAGAFAQPFYMLHDAQAVRAVVELAADLSTTVGRYPADFALCRLGTFDDASGMFGNPMVENLGTVASLAPVKPVNRLPLFEGAPEPTVTVPAPNGVYAMKEV